MSEIKPVYQLRVRFNLWEDQTKKQYEDSKFGDGVPRILYPAAAYEALQKENAELKEAAKYAEHIDATPTNQRETMLYDTLKERDTLKAESAAQAKRISELEDRLSSLPIPNTVAMQKISKLRSEGFEEYAATVLNKENQYCIVGDYGDVRWLSPEYQEPTKD